MPEPTIVAADVPRWSPRALLMAWSVPVALGSLLVSVVVQTAGPHPEFWRMLVVAAACWYVWALMTPVIERLAERKAIERPVAAGVIAVHVAASLTACAVQALTTAVASQWLMPTPGAPIGAVFLYWLLLLLPAGVIVYAAVVGLRTAEINRARLLVRERQAQQLTAQLTEARMNALRAQIQPHFLFNTLNAVIALVRDHENSRAVQALTTLGALLRTSLRSGAAHEVTFGEELRFTTNYLAIERLRYGDRLSVQLHVPSHLHDASVPTLLLQPFVENALRHGLRHQPVGGHVVISAHADVDRLVVRVEDDGQGLPNDWEARCANGFGVANSRARLHQLYGVDATLSIASRVGRAGTMVEIALPLRWESRTVLASSA